MKLIKQIQLASRGERELALVALAYLTFELCELRGINQAPVTGTKTPSLRG